MCGIGRTCFAQNQPCEIDPMAQAQKFIDDLADCVNNRADAIDAAEEAYFDDLAFYNQQVDAENTAYDAEIAACGAMPPGEARDFCFSGIIRNHKTALRTLKNWIDGKSQEMNDAINDAHDAYNQCVEDAIAQYVFCTGGGGVSE